MDAGEMRKQAEGAQQKADIFRHLFRDTPPDRDSFDEERNRRPLLIAASGASLEATIWSAAAEICERLDALRRP